jgi:hypothetical protein
MIGVEAVHRQRKRQARFVGGAWEEAFALFEENLAKMSCVPHILHIFLSRSPKGVDDLLLDNSSGE